MTDFTELLTANRFYLELKLDGSDDNVDATFLECQGFKRTQDVVEVCEVTPEKWGKATAGRAVRTKVPGNAKTTNLVLRRGMTRSMTLWNWFSEVESGKWGEQIRSGSLVIYNQSGQEQARFDFQGAWPIRYMAADVDAQSSNMEIEELEIAVETYTRER